MGSQHKITFQSPSMQTQQEINIVNGGLYVFHFGIMSRYVIFSYYHYDSIIHLK